MEQPATNPTSITINSHKIRTMTRNEKRWYHQTDIIKALDLADTSTLSKDEMNIANGQEINDPGQMLVAVISESGLAKLSPAAEQPTKDEQIAILKNQINTLEELLMDGAGPMKAYPIPARQTEKSTYINQLEAINEWNPGVIEDILTYAQNLHLETLGKSHLEAVKETMQELSDNHPHEYQQAISHIDITHDFFFDLDDTNDCSLDFVFDEK